MSWLQPSVQRYACVYWLIGNWIKLVWAPRLWDACVFLPAYFLAQPTNAIVVPCTSMYTENRCMHTPHRYTHIPEDASLQFCAFFGLRYCICIVSADHWDHVDLIFALFRRANAEIECDLYRKMLSKIPVWKDDRVVGVETGWDFFPIALPYTARANLH